MLCCALLSHMTPWQTAVGPEDTEWEGKHRKQQFFPWLFQYSTHRNFNFKHQCGYLMCVLACISGCACNNIVKLILTVSASPLSAYILYMTTPQPCVRGGLQRLVCIVWLTALSPLITTTATSECLHTSQHVNNNVDRYQHVTLGNRGYEQTTTSLCVFIFAPNMKKAVWEFWLVVNLVSFIVPNWQADKYFSLTAFCSGGWAIPLCGLVFSLWCASCSVILSVWV